MGLHVCKTLVVIMKDVEESLDDVRDDIEGMRAKTEGAVEATTLGIKPSQVLRSQGSKFHFSLAYQYFLIT